MIFFIKSEEINLEILGSQQNLVFKVNMIW